MENNRRMTGGEEEILTYSLGPNPDLGKFVRKYGKPYDPEKDDYERAPFAEEIVVSKADPIYDMHTYWSKKHYKAIMKYIEHYTEPGDLVLDQFCGSGMTGVAALALGRSPLLIDLSPAATFITKHYVTPVDAKRLGKAFQELLETRVGRRIELGKGDYRSQSSLRSFSLTKRTGGQVSTLSGELEWLYETRCDRCGGRATTGYVVWSRTFQCEKCLRIIPLYDCVSTEVVTGKGKKKRINACPYCLKEGVKVEIKTTSKKFGSVPVEVSYICLNGCKPKRANRKHNDEDPRKREFFNKCDLGKIKEIEAREIPHLYPKDRMMNVAEEQESWGYLWRKGIHEGIERVDQFFTKRNLWALSAIKDAVNSAKIDEELRSFLLFVFSGTILNTSLMYRFRKSLKGGIQMGTYYVPPLSQIMNAWNSFKDKFRRCLRGVEKSKRIQTYKKVLVSTQSACNISSISGDSIDYVFTDPSYADKVQFGELNFLWESWLGFDTSWLKDEIIINPVRGITEEDWAEMMRKAMKEAYRVLKPGRWMSLCYHDTSEGTWQTLQDILIDVGFELSDVGVLNPQQKSYNQIMADKVIKVDLVLNCRKPRSGEIIAQIEKGAPIEERVSDIIIDYLQRKPGSTKDEIWNVIVARLVSKGEMKRHDFESLLKGLAIENEARMWFLKEQYEEIQPSERRKEQRAAEAIERFMGDRMESVALTEVEFYDILFFYLTNYLRGKTRELAPMRRLPEILEDYFIRGKKGYRPPQTDDERALLKEARDKGLSRSIRRYIRHLTQASPFPEDKKPDTSTLADLIKHCRRVGMYREGIILYEKGGLVVSKLSERQVVDLNEDYRICKRRVKSQRRLP